jgi:hypothetical protein
MGESPARETHRRRKKFPDIWMDGGVSGRSTVEGEEAILFVLWA